MKKKTLKACPFCGHPLRWLKITREIDGKQEITAGCGCGAEITITLRTPFPESEAFDLGSVALEMDAALQWADDVARTHLRSSATSAITRS